VIVRAVNLVDASKASPMRAGDEAFRRFCRPDLSSHISPQQDKLVARARVQLDRATRFAVLAPTGRIQAYEFAPAGQPTGRTIGLVHGWTSEAAFMAAFVEPLRQRGHRLIGFDFPAHGRSAGRSATLIDCSRAMLAVAEAAGPFDAVIAHSVGCLVALLVGEGGPPMPRPHPIARFALIGSPNRLQNVTRDFAAGLGLGPKARRAYERHLERVGRRSVADFSAVELLRKQGAEVVLVHSRDDEHVSFSNALEIADALPGARLHAFDDLGHSKVLYAPPVVRIVRAFLDG
jgi:pimeloyl-ACP methyl ester carboxylesterase